MFAHHLKTKGVLESQNGPICNDLRMATLHLGLSGYDYKEWQGEGLFYSPEVKKTQFLNAYAQKCNSLEANGTFQRMPTEATITKWIDSTPESFTISPKMVQNVTHFKRLGPESIEIAKEFVEVLEPLKKAGKLGPILLQLPPNLKRDDDRLNTFLSEFPAVRWAVEFRNVSWNCQDVADLLARFGAGFVAAETDDEEPPFFDTADFFFARLRRLTYSQEQLAEWAKRLKGYLADGKDCFVYCRHKDTEMPWKWVETLKQLV